MPARQLSQKGQEGICGRLRIALVAPTEHLLKLVDGDHYPGILLVALHPQLPQLPVQRLRRGGVFVGGRQIEGPVSLPQHCRQSRRRILSLLQAPLRGGVGLTADHVHRRAQLQVLIELIPPALAGLNVSVGVEVEKQRAEALHLGPLLLLILQPITDPLGPGVPVAAEADEDGAHNAVAEAASGQITLAALA
jgi:hypothetical protein